MVELLRVLWSDGSIALNSREDRLGYSDEAFAYPCEPQKASYLENAVHTPLGDSTR